MHLHGKRYKRTFILFSSSLLLCVRGNDFICLHFFLGNRTMQILDGYTAVDPWWYKSILPQQMGLCENNLVLRIVRKELSLDKTFK